MTAPATADASDGFALVLGPLVPGHLEDMYASYQGAYRAGQPLVETPWHRYQLEAIDGLMARRDGLAPSALETYLGAAWGARFLVLDYAVGREVVDGELQHAVLVRWDDTRVGGPGVPTRLDDPRLDEPLAVLRLIEARRWLRLRPHVEPPPDERDAAEELGRLEALVERSVFAGRVPPPHVPFTTALWLARLAADFGVAASRRPFGDVHDDVRELRRTGALRARWPSVQAQALRLAQADLAATRRYAAEHGVAFADLAAELFAPDDLGRRLGPEGLRDVDLRDAVRQAFYVGLALAAVAPGAAAAWLETMASA